MSKHILLMALLFVSFSGAVFSQQSLPNNRQVKLVRIDDAITTDDVLSNLKSPDLINKLRNAKHVSSNSLPFSGSFSPQDINNFWTSAYITSMGGSSFYSNQSNGTPAQIWQDPSNPNNIHAIFTTAALDGNPAYPTRNTGYYFSSNRGANWTFVINVSETRAGFGAISGTSDGNALVITNTGSTVHSQIFVDVAPGVGAFTRLDPGTGYSNQALWGRIAATQYTSLTNKYVFISSGNISGVDSTYLNVGKSLNSSIFTGWNSIHSKAAEVYQIAKGTDGRIGIAYLSADQENQFNQANYGDVFFIESTDNGTSFNHPLKIYDANPNIDSQGAFRGLSLVYLGTIPKVAFDIATITTSSYAPGLHSKIGFWSPDVNGGIYKIIADSLNTFSGPRTTPYNALTSIGRVTLGVSQHYRPEIYAAFMAQDTIYGGPELTSYSFIYLTASFNGGSSWKHPERLTPRTFPPKDWTFPSISQWNDDDQSNNYVNMQCSMDDVPYSDVTNPNPLTNCRNEFFRITIPVWYISIRNIDGEIPISYSLKQNYPNPFNPTTNIRFSIPKLSNVTLKIYNVSGQEVATLVNNEVVSAGVKEVTFDATTFASGIYFYTLQAGDFKETKKMILMK